MTDIDEFMLKSMKEMHEMMNNLNQSEINILLKTRESLVKELEAIDGQLERRGCTNLVQPKIKQKVHKYKKLEGDINNTDVVIVYGKVEGNISNCDDVVIINGDVEGNITNCDNVLGTISNNT